VRKSKWQPIETAPKDGTAVDLWVKSGDGKMRWRIPDCWWHTGSNLWRALSVAIHPSNVTHWMPPPDPPETR